MRYFLQYRKPFHVFWVDERTEEFVNGFRSISMLLNAVNNNELDFEQYEYRIVKKYRDGDEFEEVS